MYFIINIFLGYLLIRFSLLLLVHVLKKYGGIIIDYKCGWLLQIHSFHLSFNQIKADVKSLSLTSSFFDPSANKWLVVCLWDVSLEMSMQGASSSHHRSVPNILFFLLSHVGCKLHGVTLKLESPESHCVEAHLSQLVLGSSPQLMSQIQGRLLTVKVSTDYMGEVSADVGTFLLTACQSTQMFNLILEGVDVPLNKILGVAGQTFGLPPLQDSSLWAASLKTVTVWCGFSFLETCLSIDEMSLQQQSAVVASCKWTKVLLNKDVSVELEGLTSKLHRKHLHQFHHLNLPHNSSTRRSEKSIKVVIRESVFMVDCDNHLAYVSCQSLEVGTNQNEFVLECSNTYMKVLPCQDPVHPHRPTRDPFPAPKGHLFSLPFTGLNCKRHYWDTTFFNGLTIVKVRNGMIESMVDSLQFQVSREELEVLCLLFNVNLEKELYDKKDESSPDGSIKATCSIEESVESDGEDLSDVKEEGRWKLVLNLTCVNVFVCHSNLSTLMLRIDSVSIAQENFSIITGVRVVYFNRKQKYCTISRSADVVKECFSLVSCSLSYSQKRRVDYEVCGDVGVVWSTGLHMLLMETLKMARALPFRKDATRRKGKNLGVKHHISIPDQLTIIFRLSPKHFSKMEFKKVMMEGTSCGVHGSHLSLTASDINISSDHHHFIHLYNLSFAEKSTLAQENRRRDLLLELPHNKQYCFEVSKMLVCFAFNYEFYSFFDKVKCIRKWLVGHKKEKLPPDLFISIECLVLQIEDDPFEVKLSDNYEMMFDENLENERRLMTMRKRVEEMKNSKIPLTESQIECLYKGLKERMSQVYIQRTTQMYSHSPIRKHLCRWVFEGFNLFATTDLSNFEEKKCRDFIKEVNPESPLPDDISFISYFLRNISLCCFKVTFALRDFSESMLKLKDVKVDGMFCGAEKDAGKRGRVDNVLELEDSWGRVVIQKNVAPIKYFYHLNAAMQDFTLTYGPCWEAIFSQVSQSLNKIFRPSLDPSPPLPFWDKWRNLLHGTLEVRMARSSWRCHCSLDPYNTTEFLDFLWSNLDWTCITGEIAYKGDLEVLLRTASKYDERCLLSWKNLISRFNLEWQCLGEANNHHVITPLSSIPPTKDHDTYKLFRSSSLKLSCYMHIHQTDHIPLSSASSLSSQSSLSPLSVFHPSVDQVHPPFITCTFYSSTIRSLQHLNNCLKRVSRPIKRGTYYKTPPTNKPKFTRHISSLRLSIESPGMDVTYWSSFRRSFGVQVTTAAINLNLSCRISLVSPPNLPHPSPPLKRRLVKKVEILNFQSRLTSVVVWLSSEIHVKSKRESFVNGKSFLMSVDEITYNRPDDKLTQMDVDKAVHEVQATSLKACWTPFNRDVVFALHDTYFKSQQLLRNLSADALKTIKLDSFAAKKSRMADKVSLHPTEALLTQLINESHSKFLVVHEEMGGDNVDKKQLQGFSVCHSNDVLSKHLTVNIVNCQVMLSGVETWGCMIVSTPSASLQTRIHHPVITACHQAKNKSSMVGCIDAMQCFATISEDIRKEDIHWLSNHDIQASKPAQAAPLDLSCQVDSGTLNIENLINDTDDIQTDVSSLQRIMSRSVCKFYWCWYGDLDEDAVMPEQTQADLTQVQEGIDAFSLVQDDLNICTNSAQYATALDIVNNLLLYTEPKKKELSEKLMDMRFKLMMMSNEADHKTPIYSTQNHLRGLLERIRCTEKQMYLIDKSDPHYQEMSKFLEETKEQVNVLSEELALHLNCYRESQLQLLSAKQDTLKKEAAQVRKIDVFLHHVQWRLNEEDAQSGICHIVLSDFLYTKTLWENDSGSHQMELGGCHVTNLLPEDASYKDVLVPQNISSRHVLVRLLCKFRPPVGGIGIKEHFELNVSPLSIQMTARLYASAMRFFFPGKPDDSDDEGSDTEDTSSATSTSSMPPPARSKFHVKRKKNNPAVPNDIDRMKERAAMNNMFTFIKISEVPLNVTYKSGKEKHIMNINNFQFSSPPLEYHDRTWSWHDLTMTLKRDCKKVLVAQAVKQKLHIKSRNPLKMVFANRAPVEDVSKSKMLLGVFDSKTKKKKGHKN